MSNDGGNIPRNTRYRCVESVNHGGAFLLIKIDSVDSMHDDKTMKHHDDMAMKSDAADLGGRIAAAAPPAIERIEVLAAKLP
jgi:hypothetical protein